MGNSDKPPENMRCVAWSRNQAFFLFLVLGVVLFFYTTSRRYLAPQWNPQWLLQYHSTNLSFILKNQSSISSYAPEAISVAHHPPQRVAHKPTTQRQTTVSSRVTKTTPNPQTTQPTAVPYVSPGPYLVEYPYEYRFTINEPKTCEQEKPFVVLIVQVAPRNWADRDVIRKTWGSEKLVQGQRVTLFFLLGTQIGDDAQQVGQRLLQESAEHHDLVQSDFVDCYKNLTIKTMVMMEWLNSYCSRAAFAMKIDSDMFLNVNNLLSLLLKASRENYMTGLVALWGRVSRDPKSKFYVPEALLKDQFYPPYALGLGYILSLDLPRKLIEASRHVKALYIEDAYLGLCMRHLGIRPTNPPQWFFFRVLPIKYSRCEYSKVIAVTAQKNTDRVKIYRDFKKPGRYC